MLQLAGVSESTFPKLEDFPLTISSEVLCIVYDAFICYASKLMCSSRKRVLADRSSFKVFKF